MRLSQVFKKAAIISLLSTGMIFSASAQAESYTVQAGDSLSAIAYKLYGASSKWKQIAEWNGLSDPNRIFVGKVLTLKEQPSKKVQDGDRALVKMWLKKITEKHEGRGTYYDDGRVTMYPTLGDEVDTSNQIYSSDYDYYRSVPGGSTSGTTLVQKAQNAADDFGSEYSDEAADDYADPVNTTAAATQEGVEQYDSTVDPIAPIAVAPPTPIGEDGEPIPTAQTGDQDAEADYEGTDPINEVSLTPTQPVALQPLPLEPIQPQPVTPESQNTIEPVQAQPEPQVIALADTGQAPENTQPAGGAIPANVGVAENIDVERERAIENADQAEPDFNEGGGFDEEFSDEEFNDDGGFGEGGDDFGDLNEDFSEEGSRSVAAKSKSAEANIQKLIEDKDYPKAEVAAKQFLANAEKRDNNKEEILRAHKFLYQIYDGSGQTGKAEETRQTVSNLKESDEDAAVFLGID